MGLVRLPSMYNYWNIDHYMPHHRVMKELGMTTDHFLFMWCNFHVYNDEAMDVQAEQKEGKAGKYDDPDVDGILEFTMECDAASDEESIIEEEEEETCGKRKEGLPSEKKIWYFKLKHLIDHVRDVRVGLIMVLKMYIALDKVMMQVCGRSSETHQMKNKPIGEGYKFFTIASVEGYVINFTPDGCTTAKSQQQEYEACNTMGKIKSMYLMPFQSLICFVINKINGIRMKF
eukprot:13088884-Ditylum_brightwellii.AAC.1